jgi:hypothetical protein
MTEAGDGVPGLLVSLMFSTCSQRSATLAMPDTPHLRPATPDESNALSFALRYQGRKRVHHADDTVARITAERIAQHLEASGFVLMKGPPRVAPRASGCRLGGDVMSSPRGVPLHCIGVPQPMPRRWCSLPEMLVSNAIYTWDRGIRAFCA